MAFRLLSFTLVRQLQINKSLVVKHLLEEPWLVGNRSKINFIYAFDRTLHVKVYDKDGLDEKRLANKYKETDELELERQQINLPKNVNSSVAKDTMNTNDFSYKAKYLEERINDADLFGSNVNDEQDDEGDVIEKEYIENPVQQKMRRIQYIRLIKENLIQHKLKDAIDVLETRMLKKDRVKPDNYIFNLLISGCAKAGYTRKAFKLFAKMRKHGLKVTGGTYTSLFNACANAPSPANGLERANYLREIMLEKGCEPNVKNYNAMIKAYGRCGDVKMAYLLADEMMEKKLNIETDTFNFLLQACASDKEYGFRHCLLTWHRLLQRNLKPDYYTFNTVLRCIRDCNFGDIQTMEEVLKNILEERSVKYINSHETENEHRKSLPDTIDLTKNIDDKTNADNNNIESTDRQDIIIIEAKNRVSETSLQINNDAMSLELPNLLAPRPHLGSLIKLSEVKLPHERFLLVGGLIGFLELMKQNNITPNIQTFTTMLEVIPPTNAAEKQLLTFVRKIGLKADIDFFNILIKKRSMRFDYESAKEVLTMINTAGLHPDIVTYGVLSLGCKTSEEAHELIQEMRNKDIRMNIVILGAMLRQACEQKAFSYVAEIMQISLDENIKPNELFLRHLNNFYNRWARAIDARYPFTKTKKFKNGYAKFCDKLRLYYEEHDIAGMKLEDQIKKITESPYQQYKDPDIDGIEHIKNEKLSKKAKVRKYIKKIKIANLRDDNTISTEKRLN